MADSKSTNQHPTMRLSDEDREAYLSVARDANFEVQQLARMLRDSRAIGVAGCEFDLAARGICTRLMELSDIVYESFLVDDKLTELDELQRRLGVGEAGHA